ncbi:hypothetical protein TVAG_291330 [Trichomonas vaginalis G3]|uniref:Bap-like n=1 Tax=Trichomonas vaginalis (strain ATCC PRA-98 / G3) TaxID=412133 RepID=A2DQR4_TRIV3|nr:hypothetical protein TVAGG3_0937430 [Trichomonas vaginalis G3]EAY17181.1 hypothetical protein TVAG_291330 [Trichomonas vaginalis G3]KAI5486292.1 hypothetical protein TVAGG3_0937430 [Trichomonas vaginalis G3]|eukprot:XP_001329404.1 hypothetical protein [Trichomonas vaginalis G3]
MPGSITTIQLLQQFKWLAVNHKISLNMQVPEKTASKYQITFSAVGNDNIPINDLGSIDFWIVDPPSISIDALERDTYANNEIVTLNYHITDSSNSGGNLTFTIKETPIVIPYTTDKYQSSKTINVSDYGLEYRGSPYHIKAHLINDYQITNEDYTTGITISIRNKPEITDVVAKKVILTTESQTILLRYKDKDNDKKLKFYYTVNDGNDATELKPASDQESNGGDDQSISLPLPAFPNPGKYNLKFYITSSNDYSHKETNSHSDGEPFEIESKNQPNVKIFKFDQQSYKYNDQVNFIFEVKDNTNGTIFYDFDGNVDHIDYTIMPENNEALTKNVTKTITIDRSNMKYNKGHSYTIQLINASDINHIAANCERAQQSFQVRNIPSIKSVKVPPLVTKDGDS